VPEHFDDFIKKLISLESKVGRETHYRILKPFKINFLMPGSLKEAARRIGDFIGLGNCNFTITVGQTKPGCAGQIDLSVFSPTECKIKISRNIVESAEATLATLAHEIAHKYLQIKGLAITEDPLRQYENEILTDITTVYLGLGKLILNGCYTGNTGQIGYLNRNELAFVYRVVCAMRRIPTEKMLQDLYIDVRYDVESCQAYIDRYFNPQFHQEEYRDWLEENVRGEIQNLEAELGCICRHLDSLKERIGKSEEFLESEQKEIKRLLKELKAVKPRDVYDPSLLFLKTIGFRRTTEEQCRRILTEIDKAKKLRKVLNRLTRLDQEFSKKKVKGGELEGMKVSFWRRVFRFVRGRKRQKEQRDTNS